jgi:hypothetical protein
MFLHDVRFGKTEVVFGFGVVNYGNKIIKSSKCCKHQKPYKTISIEVIY